MTEAKPIRESLIAKAGKCMICGHGPSRPWRTKPMECSQLCCHEIACGKHRDKALDKPFAILVLCADCNMHAVTNKKEWPEARQLSVLLRKSPEDFDLAAYNALVNERAPNRIVMSEIMAFYPAVAGGR